MNNNKFLQIDDNIMEGVVLALNYSSVKSFKEDVTKIEDWIKKQPHLPEIMDEKRIGNFLILNKGRVERTKQKIDNYYSVKSQLPHIFDGANPNLPHTRHIFEACYLVLSPKLTKEMYRVIFFKARSTSVLQKFNAVYGTRYLVNMQEIRLLEDVMYGDIFVVDGKDVPLLCILQFTPMAVYNAFLIYDKIFSSRLKAVYFINPPSFVDKLLLLLRPVLKQKLMNRIHILENNDALIDRIGREVVPRDYGGEEKSLSQLQEIMQIKFQEHKPHFEKLEKLRADENLRPEETKNDGMFGVCGNFKKLELD